MLAFFKAYRKMFVAQNWNDGGNHTDQHCTPRLQHHIRSGADSNASSKSTVLNMFLYEFRKSKINIDWNISARLYHFKNSILLVVNNRADRERGDRASSEGEIGVDDRSPFFIGCRRQSRVETWPKNPEKLCACEEEYLSKRLYTIKVRIGQFHGPYAFFRWLP